MAKRDDLLEWISDGRVKPSSDGAKFKFLDGKEPSAADQAIIGRYHGEVGAGLHFNLGSVGAGDEDLRIFVRPVGPEWDSAVFELIAPISLDLENDSLVAKNLPATEDWGIVEYHVQRSTGEDLETILTWGRDVSGSDRYRTSYTWGPRRG